MVRGPQAVCASASRDVARRAQRTPLAVFEPASCGHVQSQGLPAKDTQAIRAHFRLRASLSCGHVQLPRPLWPYAQSSPAVKGHTGHQGTLRYTRLRSCGHVHSQVQEKTRTKPLKQLTAHVDPQPHVRPTTPD